jgi:uncharacterized membrane protein YkoI
MRTRTHLSKSLAAIGCCIVLAACATAPVHVEPYRDISCVSRAPISLAQAIAAAEDSRGQTVIDAEYNIERELGCLQGDRGHYDVTLYDDGRLIRASVDAASGVVGPPRKEGVLERLLDLDEVLNRWPESEMLKGGQAAQSARISLREAVQRIEANGGKALAAHVKTENGVTDYVLELVNEGKITLVNIDLGTGIARA